MGNDSIQKTLFVAIALCLVCSILVSSSAVLLRPIQNYNKSINFKKNILEAAGLKKENEDLEAEEVEDRFKEIKIKLVDLSSGEIVEDPSSLGIDALETYNERAVYDDPEKGHLIPADKDVAGIRKRAKYVRVYFYEKAGQLEALILPVNTVGLWSDMYGFVALKPDLQTIGRFIFYEQGETAGLGGEVDNPRWKALWVGKQIYGNDGEVKIRVVKGNVSNTQADAEYMVDGLSGATITSNGVSNLFQYWLSESGYKKFLDRLKETL